MMNGGSPQPQQQQQKHKQQRQQNSRFVSKEEKGKDFSEIKLINESLKKSVLKLRESLVFYIRSSQRYFNKYIS